jgi:hypothetical protein
MPAPKGNKYALGNNGGRPKENCELTDEQLGDILGMMDEGCSPAEIKRYILKARGSFSNDLFDRWIAEDEVFSVTYAHGWILYEAWWDAEGRKNLKNKDFNYNGWYNQMKNRFRENWSDRKDINMSGELDNNVNLYLNSEGDEPETEGNTV